MPTQSHQDLLQSASTHHRAGHLRQAEEIYRQILLENPDHHEALHGVGLLAMQSARPDLAAAYLARAAQIAPSVAIYHHNLGEAWMLAGDLNQAAACLRRAIWIEPARPETHAVLGVALSRLQRFQQATESLQQAIHLGADRPEIYQHLANALLQLNRFVEAETSARKAIDRAPNSAETWQSLGESLGNQNRTDEALAAFRRAIELKSDFALPHYSTGLTLAALGRTDEAIASFQHALRIRPDFPEAQLHLGSTLLQINPDQGIEHLRKAVQLRPTHLDSHIELARGLELARRFDEAANAFEEILKLSPGNPNIEFHIAALRGKNAPAAPPAALVAALFDRHAETFDEHLTQGLQYRVPQLLHEAVLPLLPPNARLDVLDLGCGTGLCGPLFRPIAKSLVGVDLSPAMIEKARQRNVYDRLEVADVTATLRASPSKYDLLIAGDVLCYIGDLADPLTAAHSALRPTGLFAFSVELDDTAPTYRLRPSRRYAHALSYVETTARAAGFEIHQLTPTILRKESDKDVQGLIVVLRKQSV